MNALTLEKGVIMKNVFVSIFAFVAALSAHHQQALATSDAITSVHLVVQSVQEEDEFSVISAPVVGCFGVSHGPALAQFTTEYKVPSNIGCGGESYLENVNYLTCATVVSSEEASTIDGLSSLKLDISNCSQKSNPVLIKAIKLAVIRNFAPENGKIRLDLVK